MNQLTLRIPGTLKHSGEQSDASLQETARGHVERHPGLLFLADVLRALHASPALRSPTAFFRAFSPQDVMGAFAERPDLRVRTLKAITGGPTALLRRLTTEAVASQIDLLAADDLPEAERSVRAESDRTLSVQELYLKYVDPVDLATYVSARSVWEYESQDEWWNRGGAAEARALMASELRSVRRHAIMTDSEILDIIGDETLERSLPIAVRTALRTAARRAAAAGKPFTDGEMFASGGREAGRDLIDEIVEHVPLATVREVIGEVARMLGVSGQDAAAGPLKVASSAAAAEGDSAVPTLVGGSRVGPKSTPAPTGTPPMGRAAAPAKPRLPSPPLAMPRAADPAAPRATEAEGPPAPDDDFTFVEEVSGRV
jgi:hypothetical protein